MSIICPGLIIVPAKLRWSNQDKKLNKEVNLGSAVKNIDYFLQIIN
jgi:hypothetical protein